MRNTFIAVSILGFSLIGGGVEADEYFPGKLNIQSGVKSMADRASPWTGVALGELLKDTAGDENPGLLLSDDDVAAYQKIFAAEDRADWKTADALIDAPKDRRLMGYVLAKRYMHPTQYKATYDELHSWLKKYADLPMADRLHTLALKRQPKGSRGPAAPTEKTSISGGLAAAAVTANTNSQHWQAGLESWRQRKYEESLTHFKYLAGSKAASASERAAGAFWAARALTRLGRPEAVSAWLEEAANHPRTFYGLIAARQLGVESELNWSVPDLKSAHLQAIASQPAGKRALGLIQVGRMEEAEAELRRLRPNRDKNIKEGLVALSTYAGMPNLSFRIAATVAAPDGALYDAALYPMPKWEPTGGFAVDRALIYALVRQESRFEPGAKSQVGATGLMQLMPKTANYMAAKTLTDIRLNDLVDPAVNLQLGQRYVSYLLEQQEVGDNLFYLLAAYNGGPGQLAKQKREMETTNDPLLFVELMPAGETRDFIRRVLANYWIYQLQLGQKSPSLDAVAAGDWPTYQAQDLQPIRTALN